MVAHMVKWNRKCTRLNSIHEKRAREKKKQSNAYFRYLPTPTWIVTNSSLIYWIKCDIQRHGDCAKIVANEVSSLIVNKCDKYEKNESAEVRKMKISPLQTSKEQQKILSDVANEIDVWYFFVSTLIFL